MSATLARIALDRPARSTVNRLTADDLMSVSQCLADALAQLDRPATIGEDFNRLMTAAPRSFGCSAPELRQSECDELAEMVAAAILDHGAAAIVDEPVAHVGHWSTFGTFWCDTCDSPYCDEA